MQVQESPFLVHSPTFNCFHSSSSSSSSSEKLAEISMDESEERQQSPFFFHSPSFKSYSSSELADIVATDESQGTLSDENPKNQPKEDQQSPLFFHSPSFKCYSLQTPADIEATSESQDTQSHENSTNPPKEDSGNSGDEDGFEFTFCRDTHTSPINADEIFTNGQIRPVYPIFNRDLIFSGVRNGVSKPARTSSVRLPLRKLLLEERESLPSSSSSSEVDELEGIPAGTYCVWKPKSKSAQASPDICKKSNSTGSSKRWRFRDLLNRSNSDGKDRYVFLTPSAPTISNSKMNKRNEKGEKAEKNEIPKLQRGNSEDLKVLGNLKGKGEKVSAHEIHYVTNRAMNVIDRRRSFLPYRQDIVGFFANANGLSRTFHHPF